MTDAPQVHSTYFATVPEWIVLHPTLSDRAVRLFAVLARHADKETGRAFPGRARLADQMRCSPSSVDRALAELERVEAVESTPHYRADGSRTTNDYWLWPARSSSPVTIGLVTGDEGGLGTHDERPSSLVTTQEPESDERESVEPEGLDVEIDALCALLSERVGAHSASGNRPTVSARWRRDMRLLVQRGALGVDPKPLGADRVRAAIEAVFTDLATPGRDGFCWADQVRSPEALRRHWEKLREAYRRQTGSRVGRGAQTVDRVAARLARDGAQSRQPLGLLGEHEPKEITA